MKVITRLFKAIRKNALPLGVYGAIVMFVGVTAYGQLAKYDMVATLCSKSNGSIETTAGTYEVPSIDRTDYDYRNVATYSTIPADETFKTLKEGTPYTLTLRYNLLRFRTELVDISWAHSAPPCGA